MITIKSTEEVGKMRKAGALLHQVHEHLKTLIVPGVTTAYLDKVAEKLIRDAGAIPSFKGYQGFPFTLCTSVDDEVVHGFPSNKPLKDGQLLSMNENSRKKLGLGEECTFFSPWLFSDDAVSPNCSSL